MSTDHHEPPPPVIEPPPESSDAAVTLKDPKPNHQPPTETSSKTEDDPPHVQQVTTPVEHEETDQNKLPTKECPPEDDQAISNQSSQPKTQESSSKNKPVAEEADAIETLKNEGSSSSATGVDPPHVQQVATPAEHEETDQNKLTTKECPPEDDQAISNQSSQPTTPPPAEHEETDQNKLPTNEDEATSTQSSQPKTEMNNDPKTLDQPQTIPGVTPQPEIEPQPETTSDAAITQSSQPKTESRPQTSPDAAAPPPPEIEKAVTLKDPKPNQPPPTEIGESSSRNEPVAEEVDTIEPLKNEASSSDPPHVAEHEETDKTKLPTKECPAEDEAKKLSSCDKFKHFFHIPNLWPKKSQSSKSSDAKSPDKKEPESPSKLKKAVEEDENHAKEGQKMLTDYQKHLKKLHEAIDALEAQPDDDELGKLKQDLIRLSLQFPLKNRLKPDGAHKNFHFSSESKKGTSQDVLDMMPQLHKNHNDKNHNDTFFETSPAFQDFEARYNDLDSKVKLCLLCFSVFPDNQIVKKRVMVHWWLVEGFALNEEEANKNFKILIEKGFIEPVNESRKPSAGSCKMHPFYRSALVMIAEKAKFLNFGSKGEPTQNFAGCFQSCLVGEGLISYEDLKGETVTVLDLKKVHLLINISEAVLEFKKDWFSKMINLNVLYLGRWEPSATGHREVEDTLFLDELKNMKFLKFLSLQGVSNMIDLPDSVTKLTSLEILDISACHNLESIPERIGCLRFLTHLDMTDCYLLEHMPKSISSLEGLKVLKGFVVGSGKKSCKLEDLKELKNLVKLCVYTGLREFPRKEDVRALSSLERLQKLTITWGGSAFKHEEKINKEEEKKDKVEGRCALKNICKGKEEKKTDDEVEAGLPLELEKLDLRYFPTSTTPEWLKIGKMKELKKLEKLYIRAGKFSDLGQYQESDSWEWPLEKDKWKVKVLRLRYLPCIEMEWRQVQELFPELVYLEQVGCPKLSLFPCDANGVWETKKKPK